MQPIINTQIPEFKVQAYHNDSFVEVSNESLKGKWSILFFYPADFTFVCPTELGDIADKYEELKALNTEVYSVSTDTHFVHKAWWDASETIRKIKFPMIADPTGGLSRALGTYIEEAGLALRATFIIDPQGVIQVAEYSSLSIGRNAEEILRKVQAAQFVAEHSDEVCPANWKPGGATLKPGLHLVGKI
jgi:peroxiredoxin (alkyl hydroperoxide reductase subunit C)